MANYVPAWKQLSIGQIKVDLLDRDEAIAVVSFHMASNKPLVVASANLQHVHEFADRRLPSKSLSDGVFWLTLLDGQPLIRRAHRLTGQYFRHTAGSDLLEPLLRVAADLKKSVGFLGGSGEAHQELKSKLAERIPGIDIAGMWAPTRSQLVNPELSATLASNIREAGVDVLVVAFGKPLQEDWIDSYGRASGSQVILLFGAAVDFLSEQVIRAPRWIRQLGAEWLWRLALEPSRLWRRYLIDCPPAWLRVKRRATLVQTPQE